MKILAIGAHPDDIEWGCGGTLIKYAKEGHHIALLIMTAGEKAGSKKTRQSEQKAAAQLLGAKKLFLGSFLDTKVEVSPKTIGFIEKALAEFRPDEVFVNAPNDTHQDHRYVAQCALVAARNIKRVFFYEDYTSVDFLPKVFVNTGDFLDDKIKLLNCHQSQVARYFAGRLVESVKSVATYRGFQAGVKYAEGFMPFRCLLD